MASSGSLASISPPLSAPGNWADVVNGSVNQDYDNNFKLTSLAINDSSINFDDDRDGLLTQAREMSLTHDPQNGQLTDTALNSVNTNQSDNLFGELANVSVSYCTNALHNVSYTRDKPGRITNKTEMSNK